MNLLEAKKRIAMLINQYSLRGEITSADDANVKDLYYKMPFYLDMAQKHIAETKFIRRFVKISHTLPFSPSNKQFETIEHNGQDIMYDSAKAYAYSFKVDNYAEVYIEGVNQDNTITSLNSIYADSYGGFKTFKDLIYFPEDSNFKAIRLRFSGDGYYNIKDVALFPVKYQFPDNIPNFGLYIEYDMPSDFGMAIRAEIRKGDDWEDLSDFRWENPTTLAVSAYEKGEIRVEYSAKPKDIDLDTADTAEFEIAEVAQNPMILYATAQLVQKEDYSQYQLLMQQFVEQMVNIKDTHSQLQQTRIKRKHRW